MINIVHLNVHFNDERRITAVEIKLKAIPEEKENKYKHNLVARVSAAFFATTLFTDNGASLKTILNPKREDVVDLYISLKENSLNFDDVAKFVNYLQKELDNSPF
ncbi:hypothetical protein IKF20_01820 [Candidatus Saccharibacteria bacterium]|nr:hypothetical protein [Candidatus Saccharibacteria bacterium]